jgi:hypothetical protein
MRNITEPPDSANDEKRNHLEPRWRVCRTCGMWRFSKSERCPSPRCNGEQETADDLDELFR